MNLFSLYAKIGLDTSEYDKGVKQSQSKSKELKTSLESVSDEVKKLEDEYKSSASSTEQYGKETSNLSEKLDEAKKSQSELSSEIEKGSSSYSKYVLNLSDIGSKISTVLVTGLKAAATAVGAAATGIGALSVAAINSYAEYEQLVGGVETLFGAGGKSIEEYAESVNKSVSDVESEYNALMRSQQTVLNNADAAYKNAGMSANEYMETVTSFSATLLQGLGNDTQKAAEYGNKAVVQMSDNANKMGTSIGLIQNAYQGFAKQNYTMLDNLKLGYGGTQAEMARLINDSGVLGDTMEVTAETVNQVSFATIIDAIGVMQDRLGITGTTADEAASTIEGSVNSMKAAWSNLMTALTAEDWDVGVYVENFAESFKTVVANIAPRLTEALPNITTALGSIFEQLAPYLSTMMQTLLPVLVQGAITLVTSLAAQLPSVLSVIATTLQSTFTNIISSLSPEIQSNLQSLFDTFQTLAPAIAGVTAAITAFRTAMTIAAIVQGVVQAINAFKAANDAATISQALLNAVMNANPFILIVTLIVGVVTAIITLWNTNEGFRNAVMAAWEAIKSGVSTAIEAIKTAITAVIDFFKNLGTTISETFSDVLDAVLQFGSDIINKIKEGISAAWDGLVSWFTGLWDSLFGNKSVDVNVNANASGTAVDGSHANGLDYVPFDGYIAELHKGEMVVPAAQADALRSGDGGVVVQQTIYAAKQTPVELAAATKAYWQRARWAL